MSWARFEQTVGIMNTMFVLTEVSEISLCESVGLNDAVKDEQRS